jgi:hypothetical protein
LIKSEKKRIKGKAFESKSESRRAKELEVLGRNTKFQAKKAILLRYSSNFDEGMEFNEHIFSPLILLIICLY